MLVLLTVCTVLAGTGGINGSILKELDRPESRGLKIATNMLLKVQQDFDNAGKHISFADLVALGGLFTRFAGCCAGC